MFDWEVIIVGGGPAGLTAGLYLSRFNVRTLLLEKENFGGPIINYELIENYPGFADGISGSKLASQMVSQATKFGLQLKQASVIGIELYENGQYVKCADGSGYMTSSVILATGSQPKKLGIPGEQQFEGKGIFHCAMCDGNKFINRKVIVCGGGDAGITEALFMTKLASSVVLIEAMPNLGASAILSNRARANSKLEIYCGVKAERIIGSNTVEGIEYIEINSGKCGTMKTDGILIHVGQEPNTNFLVNVVKQDDQGCILVNDSMETDVVGIFAIGDIRNASPRQIASAVGDGVVAAVSTQKYLHSLGSL